MEIKQKKFRLSSKTLRAYVDARLDLIELCNEVPLNILDVGCATGATGAALKQIYLNAKVSGIEYNIELGREASKHYDHVEIGNLDNMELNKLFTEKFDTVFLGDVLEHTINPSANLKKIKNICTPGAIFILSLPNVQHITVIFNLLLGKWPQRDRGIFDRTHLRWFTKKSILEMLSKNGMEIIKLNRKYRFIDAPSKNINRFAKYAHFGFFKNFLTYQYIAVVKVTEIKDQ
jgi:2-polyprenyl-3-methyl-5-hydroxy-6-metoxy-1,4-benzoquinol methylase